MSSPIRPAGVAARPAALVGAGALSGALHALALPPFGVPGLAFVALVPFLLAQRAARDTTTRLLSAGAFGLVSVVGVIHWVPSVLVSANGFAPLHAGVLSLAVFGYYTAFFVLLAPLLRWMAHAPAAWVWAPAFAWGAMEGVRDAWVPGLAWTTLAHALTDVPVLVQAAEWLGGEGLSLVVVLVDALIAQALWAALQRRARAAVAAPALAAAAVVMLLAGAGWVRLRAEEHRRAASAPLAMPVAAVQIAVPQSERWKPEAAWDRVDALLAETRRAARAGARLVVWPETAVEVHLDEAQGLGAAVERALADRPGTLVLAGAPRAVQAPPGTRYYNSAVLLDAEGRRLGLYDKVVLYPGSEYVPDWVLALPGARRVLASQLRWAPYSPGSDAAPLRADGWSLGVLICAEGVVPGPARRRVRAGATLLVHLANDAVLDAPAAVAQHFAIARLRAVETRRDLVRASNRGVSAVVGASGRILARAAPDRPGIAVASVAPRTEITWATRSAWLWPWACIVVVWVAGLTPTRRATPDVPRASSRA